MGEGNGNPLQCSCLENAGDGGAWWAAIYGVAQSQTRVKWLSNSSSREKQYHFNLYSRVPLVVKESTRLWNFFVKLHRIRSGHNSKPRTMTCATTNMGIFFCKATLKGEILKRLKDIVWFHFGCYNKIWGFPGGSHVKVSAYNAGNPCSIPGLGRSPGEWNGNWLQHSCLENSMGIQDREAWWVTAQRVAKSQTWLKTNTHMCKHTHARTE